MGEARGGGVLPDGVKFTVCGVKFTGLWCEVHIVDTPGGRKKPDGVKFTVCRWRVAVREAHRV